MGGAQVFLKNLDVLRHPSQGYMWPLLAEMFVSLVWSYGMLLLTVVWALGLALPAGTLPAVTSPLSPQGSGLILGTTCLLQFAFSTWLDRRYERGLGRNLFWMIWYPFAFWIINTAATVVAYPQVLLRRHGKRARWISPDRGFRP
jgi:biofilm PGA synthesis N-glycosyltransferase PgaC